MKKYVLISEVEYHRLTKPIEKLENITEEKEEIPEPEVEKPQINFETKQEKENDIPQETLDKPIQRGKGIKRQLKETEVNIVKKRWKKLR